jgi:Zn-dependent protease with chaperone function
LTFVILFLVTWLPASIVAKGNTRARAPRFKKPGPRLRRDGASVLFDTLDEIAEKASTKPPKEVYLAPQPTLYVAVKGGFLGIGGRRVLVIGVPYLDTLTVQEMRAVLARELGHFAGSDTRLGGVMSYAEATFRAVVESVAIEENTNESIFEGAGRWVASFIGVRLVNVFAWLYLRLTRPEGRRQTLAADRLSAKIAGRDATIRALERSHVMGPLYTSYLTTQVERAVLQLGAIPTDVIEGFRVFRERVTARGLDAVLEKARLEEKTDRFDTRVALEDRIAALRVLPEEGAADDDSRPGIALLDERTAFGPGLVTATHELFRAQRSEARKMTWAEIHTVLVRRVMVDAATHLFRKLRGLYPGLTTNAHTFAATVHGFEAGDRDRIAFHVEPTLRRLHPLEREKEIQRVAASVLRDLFQGALVDRGAAVEVSLGEECAILTFEGEQVYPGVIVNAAMKDDEGRKKLREWADRLTKEDPPPPRAHSMENSAISEA